MNEGLAALDSAFVLGCAVCLITGYRAIRRREIERHRARMLGGFACAAAFLILFVIRFVRYGFRFAGGGVAKGVYYGLLFAHEPLAVISVPMAIVTVFLGLTRSKFHVEVARPTLVIWLIACATGLVLFLYVYVIR